MNVIISHHRMLIEVKVVGRLGYGRAVFHMRQWTE